MSEMAEALWCHKGSKWEFIKRVNLLLDTWAKIKLKIISKYFLWAAGISLERWKLTLKWIILQNGSRW